LLRDDWGSTFYIQAGFNHGKLSQCD